MDSTRMTALVTGVLFVITFLTSIPAVVLYGPVLSDPQFVLGAGPDAGVRLGALLEVILVLANIGTAVALYPVLRRQSEGLALGYVMARVIECIFIIVGIVAVLAVLTLRQEFAGSSGAAAAALVMIGRSLVAIHDWTFLLGPGFVVGLGNGLLLGYLMYRSGLVPRRMTILGLIGGPLVSASGIAVMFGLYAQISLLSFFATVPEIIWEASLAIWLIVKGFRPSPILELTVRG